jgi:DNA polymerase I-like protein with 3'-5' exonuclease and polymerase domains
MLARIEAFRLLQEAGIEFLMVQTIHDSIVVDAPNRYVGTVAKILQESVAKVPDLCYTNWMYRFSLPLTSEVLVGPNKKDMTEWVSQ